MSPGNLLLFANSASSLRGTENVKSDVSLCVSFYRCSNEGSYRGTSGSSQTPRAACGVRKTSNLTAFCTGANEPVRSQVHNPVWISRQRLGRRSRGITASLRTAVERIWHMYDSHSHILAVAFGYKSLQPFMLLSTELRMAHV